MVYETELCQDRVKDEFIKLYLEALSSSGVYTIIVPYPQLSGKIDVFDINAEIPWVEQQQQ